MLRLAPAEHDVPEELPFEDPDLIGPPKECSSGWDGHPESGYKSRKFLSTIYSTMTLTMSERCLRPIAIVITRFISAVVLTAYRRTTLPAAKCRRLYGIGAHSVVDAYRARCGRRP
jgi:hypothetical protein